MTPSLYGNITATFAEVPKKPISDKQKAALEKARKKRAENRQTLKSKMVTDTASAAADQQYFEPADDDTPMPEPDQVDLDQPSPTSPGEEDRIFHMETPLNTTVPPLPETPHKVRRDEDDCKPPAWFSAFIRETAAAKTRERNRRKPAQRIARIPPEPRAPPPSPETPPHVKEVLAPPDITPHPPQPERPEKVHSPPPVTPTPRPRVRAIPFDSIFRDYR